MPPRTLADRVCDYVDRKAPNDLACHTEVNGLIAIRSHKPTALECMIYQPSVCLILQGSKETHIGTGPINFGAGASLVVSHELPIVSRVTEAPYVGLALELDLDLIHSLCDEVDVAEIEEERTRAVNVGETDDAMQDAMGRLFDLVDRPLEAKVMDPLFRREVHFRLLLARHGTMVRQLLQRDSHASKIAKAISWIRQDFAKPLAVPDLAHAAGMSPSSFHEHFKAITATTPLQYQKDLRLLEARRLLMEGRHSVASAAFGVGYESPTQFSREYSRKFGNSPRTDLVAP